MVGEHLIQKGLITPEQLQEALEIKKQYPTKKILDILYDKNYISKDNFLKELAKELNVKYISSLDNISLTKIKVPVAILKQVRAIPIDIKLDRVLIAAENPLDWNAKSYFQRFFPYAKLEFVLAHKEDIEKVLRLLENKEQINKLKTEIKRELRGEEVPGDESAVVRLIKFII